MLPRAEEFQIYGSPSFKRTSLQAYRMKTNHWTTNNHPRNFWQCESDLSDEIWQTAIINALPALGLNEAQPDIDSILALTLGEARFGPEHWNS